MDPEEEEGGGETKQKSALVPTIIAFVVISVIAAGAGWFLGTGFSERGLGQEEEKVSVVVKKDKKKEDIENEHDASAEDNSEDGEGGEHEMPQGPTVAMLEPIVSSLGDENGIWLRLEVAVIFGKGKKYDGEIDRVAIQSDIVSYLRTIDAALISGPSGFLHLHEDLVDRVRMTTDGRAEDVKVLSMVAE